MYKIELWYNSGSDITYFDNEKEAKEYMKINRDSHMDIYFNDNLIYTVSTLLRPIYIDKLDFKTTIEKINNKEIFTFNEWIRINYGEYPSYLFKRNGDHNPFGLRRVQNEYDKYLKLMEKF